MSEHVVCALCLLHFAVKKHSHQSSILKLAYEQQVLKKAKTQILFLMV